VKITVIATGFRTAPTRHRQQETRTSFAARNDDAMDFPSRQPADQPAPERIMSSANESHSELSAGAADGRSLDGRSLDDRSFDESFACGAGTSGLAYSSHATQSIPVDPIQPSIANFEHANFERTNFERTNFEQDDLDVPAFLRKRSDVM
jgi:uncharacterized protein YjbI with pentapeptide repeats